MHVVYWLYNKKNADPETHGYIGVTSNFKTRLKQHLKTKAMRVKKLPQKFKWKILFTGSRDACLKYEGTLRPLFKIGWNSYAGGGRLGNDGLGVPKSTEHREKIRLASIRRWKNKAARKRQSLAVKKGLRGIDRSGANNAMWGKHMSEEAKEKVRQKIIERGGVWGRNNPNYKDGSCIKD